MGLSFFLQNSTYKTLIFLNIIWLYICNNIEFKLLRFEELFNQKCFFNICSFGQLIFTIY